jgi:hypothetical protein
MKAAERSGAHVAIMTDYDLTGVHIALLCNGIPWIGVDNSTLEYFDLNRDDLAVDATNLRLVNTVEELTRVDGRFKDVDIDFLENKRVEIDAILSQVGGERLWEFIQRKLTELYPTRNYNRAIELPAVETLYRKPVQDHLTFINEYYSKLIAPKVKEITKSLSKVTGMIDIDEKQEEIQDELQKIVDADDGVKSIMIPVIEKLLAELRARHKAKK